MNFRTEAGRSHYYTARETAAAPVLVGAQPEKFLFYRGVGMFPPPLTAVANPDGSVAVRSVRGLRIGDVVFFENRRGAMAATAHTLERPDAVLPRPELEDASGAPLRELAQLLVKNGLYEKEAQAMVKTWSGDWFGDEGTRVLYIVPNAVTTDFLPIRIDPKPETLVRVLVGRHDVLTPEKEKDVDALVKQLNSDSNALSQAADRILNQMGRYRFAAQNAAASREKSRNRTRRD